jgi:hypothetical protein
MSPFRTERPPRQGVILLIVVIMLTLFLVVGLSFVLYAESEATASRIYREVPIDKADVPPEQLLAWALGQLIYDVPDDAGSVFSAMRGHSLARTMYGWNYNPTANGPYTAANPMVVNAVTTNLSSNDPTLKNTTPYSQANVTPFNGLGPLRTLPQIITGVNEYDMVNYTAFATDGFVRDPERPGTRATVNAALQAYAGGFNIPYSYPDRANMFLGAVQVLDYSVNPPQPFNPPHLIAQSFFRPTATLPYRNSANTNALQIDPTMPGGQTFWTSTAAANAAGKYLVLRPRPAENPGFPMPADAGGDVKNLPGVTLYVKDANPNLKYPNNLIPVQNDSFWMDLNAPVQITKNGKKYKPLFAFLVLDLDSKLNLNVHGNTALVSGLPPPSQQVGDQSVWQTREHGSNQGLGRHEINIGKVLSAVATDPTSGSIVINPITNQPAPEWVKLFTGSTVLGRYGSETQPQPTTNTVVSPYNQIASASPYVYLDPYNAAFAANPRVPPSTIAANPGYPTWLADQRRTLLFPFDLDAGFGVAASRRPTQRFALPFGDFGSFPAFDASQPGSYDSGRCTFNTAGVPTNDPVTNHPFLNQLLARTATDVVFADDNMYHVMAGDFRKSYLYSLIPNNLNSIGVRQLLTTRSYDVDMPGAPPWVTSSTASKYVMPAVIADPNTGRPTYPTGQLMLTPTAAQIPAMTPPANDYSDYKLGDGRANLLSRIDLARKLTPYTDPTTGRFVPPIGPAPSFNPVPPPAAATLYTQLPLTTSPQYRYYWALYDRQQFAMDILLRLIQATGACSLGRIQAQQATADEYAAVRYLAQLAVNIVDYVDDDDVITPFPWNNVGAFPWNAPSDAVAKAYEPQSQSPGWVFGVEAPKLVINEAYCELQNDPTEKTQAPMTGPAPPSRQPFQFCFWLELYNPTPAASPPLDTTTTPGVVQPAPERKDPEKVSTRTPVHDRMAAQLDWIPNNPLYPTRNFPYPIYEVAILDENTLGQSLKSRDNTDGWLSESIQQSAVRIQTTAIGSGTPSNPDPGDPYTSYFDANFVEPTAGVYNTQTAKLPRNQGFYVLAPQISSDFQLDQGTSADMTPTMRMRKSGDTIEQPKPTAPALTDPVWGRKRGGLAQDGMTYAAPPAVKSTAQFAVNKGSFQGGRTHTVLLRRLACPSLDPNPLVLDPGDARYGQPFLPTKPFNPYVTVDYMSGVPTNDAVKILPGNTALAGQWNDPAKGGNYMAPGLRRSIGRHQPYAAALADYTLPSAPANPVRATFFSHNQGTQPNQQQATGAIDAPFDWLIHLDRAPTTVAELLNVSALPPHQLTQAFLPFAPNRYQPPAVDNTSIGTRTLANEIKYQHVAPWQDQNARIYRALEFFTVGDRSPYPGTCGRVPGKVNINTAFDKVVFDALADAKVKGTTPNSNFFYETPGTTPAGAVTDAWTTNAVNSLLQRKAGMITGTGPAIDRPFWPFASPVEITDTTNPNRDPQYAGTQYSYPFPPPPTAGGVAGIGIGDTILGGTFTPQHSATQVSVEYTPTAGLSNPYSYAQPPAQAAFDPSEKYPPYILNEMLTKIAGHVTPRSNNFAVFLTVGFFEVTNDTTLPVQLGAELVSSNGKTIRHQMFSVVDRTNLAIDAGKAFDPTVPNQNGRLQQAATPPVFMSLADAIPAGAGAPATANAPATPLVVNVAGGLPTNYDSVTPVTFKPFQQAAAAFLANPPAPFPQPPPATRRWTYWPSGTCQWMFLDSGATQEPVQVTLDQTGTRLQLLFPNGAQFSHPPGAMLCTYQPGNPGPQGAIDYSSPQYKAVVPYTYIVQ